MPDWEFYRHMPVFIQDGRMLGKAIEIAHGVEYLHVREGHILVRDWYVPISAVDAVTTQGVKLRVGREELRRNRWNIPSEEYLRRQGATPGYEYTSRSDIPPYGAAKRGGREHQAEIPEPNIKPTKV